MLISRLFLSEDPHILCEDDYENSPEHRELKERLRKTLYYGRTPSKKECPSLPVTEIAVELLQEAAPRQLGKVDEFVASNLSRRASVSPCALMVGLIYIERLKHRNPEYLQQISSSDLFLISMMVASKYLYDEGVEEEVYNDDWANSGKMEVQDLNDLEREFLSAIDWNLFIKVTDFQKILHDIERRVAVRKGRERGFYIYSDLLVLVENEHLRVAIETILLQVCRVLLVCSVAYVAGVMTLLGSAVSLAYLKTHAVPLASVPVPNPSVMTPTALQTTSAPVQHSCKSAKPAKTATKSNETDTSHDAGYDQSDTVFRLSLVAPKLDHTKPTKDGLQLQQRTRDLARVSLPSFLTLTVIRETLMQFVTALREHLDQRSEPSQDSNHGNPSNQGYICSCGCCHGNTHVGCHNVSAHDATCWRSAETDTPCNNQRCCCPINNPGPWYDLRPSIMTPLQEMRVNLGTRLLVDAVS